MTEVGENTSPSPRVARRRRIVKIVGVVLLVAALLVGAAAGLSRTSLFSVETVEVTGTGPLVSESQVRDAAGVEPGTPLVSIEENRIASRVEGLPGVKNAQVSTSWPDTVSIVITERSLSLAGQTDDGKWASVSSDGVVVRTSDRPEDGLPAIVGLRIPSNPGARVDDNVKSILEVAATLPESLRGQVVQIQDTDDTGIRLGLRSGVIVEVGSSDQLADKLTAAAAVLRQVEQSQISSLDVRSPSLPVTNPKESVTRNPQPTSTTSSTSTTTTVAR